MWKVSSSHEIAVDRSGASAVEFALFAPILLLLLFGIAAFGTLLSTYNGVQQITAEAARASLAGSTASERDQLARTFITRALPSYPYLNAAKLTVATSTLTTPAAFKVSLSYDLSGSISFNLGTLVPLPAPTLTRSSVVLLTSG